LKQNSFKTDLRRRGRSMSRSVQVKYLNPAWAQNLSGTGI